MFRRRLGGCAIAVALLIAPARGSAVTFTLQTPISGDPVPVVLSVADAAEGDAVDIQVSIPPGSGDLLGLFGNVTQEALVPLLGVIDPAGHITQWQFQANQVWKVGGGNTMAPVKNWDWGVRIGQQGSGGGAVESVAFRLTAPGLTTAHLIGAANQGWVFGVRIQATAGPEGSSKIGLPAGQAPDPEAPTIQIATPVEGALLPTSSVVVSGVVTGTNPTVNVNGIPAQVAGGSFSALVPLVEGANTLVATAQNAAGVDSDTVHVTRGEPPTVQIAAPASGAVFTQSPITVSGSVTGTPPVSVTVNGVAATLAGGSFSAQVPLTEGSNTIVAAASNPFGSDSTSVMVTLGTAPQLSISIEAPPDGARVSSETIAVSGSVSDPAATVRVNGVLAAVTGTHYVAEAVPLLEGGNDLVATASLDAATASDTAQVTFHAPPEISITSPRDNATLRTTQTDVEGVVDDVSAFVDVNGVPAQVSSGGSFVARDVPVALGENELTARAIDAFGGRGADQVTVTRDDGAAQSLSISILDSEKVDFLDRFEFQGPFAPPDVVANTAGDFEDSLSAIGFPGQRFSAPIDVITVGVTRGAAIVFSEDPGDVTLEATGLFGPFPQPLQPIEELYDELAVAGVDLALPELLLPTDFEARFFRAHPFEIREPSDGSFGYQPRTLLARVGPASRTASIVVDDLSPEARIVSPAFGSVIRGNVVTITGTVEDATAQGSPIFDELQYRVTSDTGFVTSGVARIVDGRFSIPDLVLDQGVFLVEAIALDVGRSVAPASFFIDEFLFEIDPQAPALTAVEPSDGEALLASSTAIDINFAVPATLTQVCVEPAGQPRTCAADGRSFPAGLAVEAVEVPLTLGANRIDLEGTDAAGSFVESFTLFRVESRGPIRISSPADGAFLNTDLVTVTGTVPLGTPLVEANGVLATMAPDGVGWSAQVPLAQGENQILAIAFPFGQTSSIRVRTDSVAPRLRALVPPDGSLTPAAEVSLVGFVDQYAVVEAIGPGGAATARTRPDNPFGIRFGSLDLPELFELPPLALVPGTNAITLRLSDRAGNLRVVPVTVTRAEHALRVVAPADGSITPELRVDLELEAFAAVTLDALFVGGRRIASFDGLSLPAGLSTLANVPLAPGSNDLRITYRRPQTSPEVLALAVHSTSSGTASVRGTVRDEQTGAPVGGALVSVTVDGIAIVLVTDGQGVFALAVRPGALVGSITAEGFLGESFSATLVAGQILDLDAPLTSWARAILPVPPGTPSGTTLAFIGHVTDAATGAALPAATVEVTSGGAVFAATSAADGSYAVPAVPTGGFTIDARRLGYFSVSAVGASGEGRSFEFDFALEPVPNSVTLVGQVNSGITGAAEPFVGIELLGSTRGASSDAAGRFVIEAAPTGTQSLRLSKPGFLEAIFTAELLPRPRGLPAELEFNYPTEAESSADPRSVSAGILAIPEDAAGVVRDVLTGAPLAGALVRVGLPNAVAGADGVVVRDEVPPEAELFAATTDEAGRFAFVGLPLGEQLAISASVSGHEPQLQFPLVVVNGDDPLEFHLDATTVGAIGGRITDATSGAALPLAEVSIVGSQLLAAASEADGTYGLVSVPSGLYELEIRHPAYLPTRIAAVAVADSAETVVDAALARRPTTGALHGTITDVATGAPIAAAEVSMEGGGSDTTGSDGRYELSAVPAGLVTLSIRASGFADTARDTRVLADPDPSSPAVTTADFQLASDGSVSDSTTAVISAAQGGSVSTPDGRLRLDVLPLGLSTDARITLRTPEFPVRESGDPLDLDPALGVTDVVAVGREVEIVVAPVDAAGLQPELIGPVVLSLAYSGSGASALGVAEESLFPYYFDGARWTALRVVPPLYAVDKVNETVVAVLSFTQTEGGAEVAAAMGFEAPVLVAQVGGGPLPVARSFLVHLGGALSEFSAPRLPNAVARIVDLGTPTIDLGNLSGPAESIHDNALPVLVMHGWEPFAIIGNPGLDSQLQTSRYRTIIQDLLAGTNGVYRPIYVTYSPRLSISANANRVAGLLRGKFRGDSIRGIPTQHDPDSGKFKYNDAFGYSMGGLVARAYQCGTLHVQNLVTMGTPHHGALKVIQTALEEIRILQAGPFSISAADVLRLWSPGSAQLLDYVETPPGGGNPWLYELNERLRCSRPKQSISLIAGDDATSFLPVTEGLAHLVKYLEQVPLAERPVAPGDLPDEDPEDPVGNRSLLQQFLDLLDPDAVKRVEAVFSLGTLMNAEIPNDTIVPERSAQARRLSGAVVSALAGTPGVNADSTEDFNHFNGGTEAARISQFADDLVFPTLSDWTVAKLNSESVEVLPTAQVEGEFTYDITVDFNAHHGDVTGVTVVVYGEDRAGNWHILAGADPESREPTDLRSVRRNSAVEGAIDLTATVRIPPVNPSDPSTDLVNLDAVVAAIGGEVELVPEDPTQTDFGLPPAPPP